MDIYSAISNRRTIRDFEDKPIKMDIIEKIIAAGLKAPTNDHMRSWEFVVVNDKSVRAELVKVLPNIATAQTQIHNWLDSWNAEDKLQRDMYLEALPKQAAMLFNAGCLILPFFRQTSPLLNPKTISSLNGFASIWCCIENILLAATAEGIFGVTKIPIGNEAQNIKNVINHPDNYIMPCYIALGYPVKAAVINIQNEFCVKEKLHINSW